MFKRIALASVVAFVLIAGAAQPASAQTADDIQQQIRELVQRIADLTAQLNILRGQNQNQITQPALPEGFAKRICAITLRPFAIGDENEDVKAIQEFLQGQGYFDRLPTGYWGDITRNWLARWQAAQGFEAAGIIGPRTIGWIQAWCNRTTPTPGGVFTATPTSGEAPLTVTFKSMVGGFHPASTSYVIDFGDGSTSPATECSAPADACVTPGTNAHTYTTNGTYVAQLIRKEMNTCQPTAGTVCAAWTNSEQVVGTATITVGGRPQSCTREYAPVCGQPPMPQCNAGAGFACMMVMPQPQTYANKCLMAAEGAALLYEGQCKTDQADPSADPQCKSWNDGCNICTRSTPDGAAACTLRACFAKGPAYCTAYFDGTTPANRPPTVSGISGPTTLSVNQSGTWTVNASDPENGTLSYSVDWGDTGYWATSNALGALTVLQTSTFTHSYAAAGTYTIKVTVTDNKGATAQTTTTVKVGSTVTACTLEYAPVCGQPPMPTCPAGLACTMMMPSPQTYGNRCQMNAAGASFLYEGQCTTNQPITACTADAYQCPNGEWVGRTGPNCQFVCSNSGFGTTNAACSFDTIPAGAMCGGQYHCTQRNGAHFWSTQSCAIGL